MNHEELTERVIGNFYDLYNELGHGFLESVYQKAYTLLLTEQGISFHEQAPIPVFFRQQEIGIFRADLIVEAVA